VELAIEARAGHKESFGILVERYQGRLFAQALGLLGRSDEAEEVTQETFVRAWQHLDDLRDTSAFAGWLGRIVANIATDRRRRRLHQPLEAAEHEPAPTGTSPDDRAANLWSTIQQLSPEYREAFLLVHLENLSYREAAAQIGVPVSTIEGRVYKAKQFLRGKMRTS